MKRHGQAGAGLDPDHGATAFEQHRGAPHAVQLANAFAAADLAEAGRFTQAHTGRVFGENARLQRPQAVLFRFGH